MENLVLNLWLKLKSKSNKNTICVYIPCVPIHFDLLYDSLDSYICGTVLPDEIIIGVSECKKVPKKK